MKKIDPELIAKLLNDDKTPQEKSEKLYIVPVAGQKPPKLTQRGPWRYRENPLKCVSKRCGVQTWMTFDGVPYCTVHGLNYLNDLVVKMTDRLEEAYKRRSENRVNVVGDLLGNYDEGDKVSDEENREFSTPENDMNPAVQNDEESDVPEQRSDATTGNQSDEEVAEIQSGDRPEASEAP